MSAGDRAVLLDSWVFQTCLQPDHAMDCLLRAASDPEFRRGWKRVSTEDPVDPTRLREVGHIIVRYFPFFTDVRLMGQAVALIDASCNSLAYFHSFPKWTPQQHEDYFVKVEQSISAIVSLLDDPYGDALEHHGIFSSDLFEIRAALTKLHEITQFAKGTEMLSRPHAKHADRTYVAKDLIQWSRQDGAPSYGAIASVLNATFPNYDPIDAGFVQAIARKLPRNSQ